MIQEQKTRRYTVNPKKMIDDAFESAYSDGQDGPVVRKPDLAVTITGILSMLIVTGMYLATFIAKGKSDKLWLIRRSNRGCLPLQGSCKAWRKQAPCQRGQAPPKPSLPMNRADHGV